ncbi:MAG: hypothetical protein ACHRXM_07920 [Isosphaerales bacterium]
MTITQSALSGSSIDPLLLVYNSAGILVASDNEGAGGQISQVQFSVQPGQTYEVGAGSLGLTLGSYSLSISTQDSGDSLAQAVTVSLSDQGTASVSGQVDTAGEADFFQFVAPFSGRMAVQQDTAPGSSMRVAPTVLDASGNPVPVVSQTNLAGVTSVRVVFPVTAGQVYTIRAGAAGEDTGGDTVYIAPAPPLEGSAGIPTISLSNTGYATLPGAIGFPGASVQYRFTAPVSGLLAISQQASGGTALDSVLSVYDASGTLLARKRGQEPFGARGTPASLDSTF